MASRKGFTDEELRLAKLHIDDPYAQEGVVDSLDEGVTLVEVLNTYVFKEWPRKKVGCVRCGAHRHKKGCTVSLSSGDKCLVGSACGQKLFGVSWATLYADLRDGQRRQSVLRTLDDMAPRLLAIGAALLRWRSAARHMQQEHDWFRTVLPDLYGVLQREAKRGGALTVYTQIDARERAKWEGGAQVEFVHTTYHNIVGREYLLQATPVLLVDQADTLVRQLAEASADTSARRTKELETLKLNFSRIADQLVAFAQSYWAMDHFYGRANIEKIAEWATVVEELRGNYRLHGDTLICEHTRKGLRLAAAGPPLDTALLKLLDRELAGPPVRARSTRGQRR